MNDKQSGRRNYGKRDFGGPAGFRQMYKAVCGSCGRDCEVPFQPSGNRPVFCSNCFEKNKGNSITGRFEDRNFKRPFEDRNNKTLQSSSEQYNTINAKLDKILELLSSISIEKKKKISKKTVLPPEA